MKENEKTQKTESEAIKEAAAVKQRWSAKKWLTVIVLLLAVLAIVPLINELIPQKVNVKYVGFDGEETASYWTRAHKVSGFAGELGEIEDDDVITGLVNVKSMEKTPGEIIGDLKAMVSGGMREVPAAVRKSTDKNGSSSTAENSENTDSISASRAAASGKAVKSDVTGGGSQDAYIRNGMTITVMKAEESKARIGGDKQEINIYPGTVKETLRYNKIDFDEDDVIKPALDEEVKSGDSIRITRVKIVNKDKTLDVEPQERDAVFDKSLASGTIVRSEGKPGKAVYTYTYKYVNGKKIRTTKKFKKWKKKPEDIQLKFGTSVTGETGEARYGETFIGECTAYYFGNSATGAIGQRCHYGTCAVDPKVIPYGTKLYVEGYGTAIANDCGGAVKGHIIDLYMRSTKECFQWGRRNRKVYILK